MFLEYILSNFLIIYILETSAAVAGIIYLKKVVPPDPGVRLFVLYLWIVIFVEIVGLYPSYAYIYDYTRLGFIKGTAFERNYWWYNSYTVLKFGILYVFFILQLDSSTNRRKLLAISVFLVLTFIVDLIFRGEFFRGYSAYMSIVGTLYLMFLIFLYHFKLLKSNKILNFYRRMPFYISIGLLVWHVSTTPLFIYSKYFSLKSPEFVNLQYQLLKSVNIFLYGVIILGFVICSLKGKEPPAFKPRFLQEHKKPS